jgi:hypothetical protein
MGAVTGRRHATGPVHLAVPILALPTVNTLTGRPPSTVPRTTNQAFSQQDRPALLQRARPGRHDADHLRACREIYAACRKRRAWEITRRGPVQGRPIPRNARKDVRIHFTCCLWEVFSPNGGHPRPRAPLSPGLLSTSLSFVAWISNRDQISSHSFVKGQIDVSRRAARKGMATY